MWRIKSPADIAMAESRDEVMTRKSEVEAYWQLGEWELPCKDHLLEKHPLTKVFFWKDTLRTAGQPVSDFHCPAARMADVESL